MHSLRCSLINQLHVATTMKEFDAFYFPHNLDFRGRAYPVPPHLNHLGSDICRGLLKFAEKKPLGKRGLYWLKVHLHSEKSSVHAGTRDICQGTGFSECVCPARGLCWLQVHLHSQKSSLYSCMQDICQGTEF
jgi:hypothetical protein